MASSSSARSYEVFLSFRGEDTRKGFVSHLYDGLQRKGIITFKDDQKLQTGDSLSNELPKAIQESKFAVVVISQNYASSRWCLDELQMIMERHKKGTLKVVPIFYEVDPSHVRNQGGTYAEAFKKHQSKEEPEEKIQKWREALTEVAGLTGKDSRNCQDEATMVRNIVGEISNQLLSMSPEDTSDIFGMDAHFEGLAQMLNMGSEDNKPRMIGIWGMGGIGKTTIAKCLYSKYKCQFPYHCFIENVKKFYNESGQEKLQRLFLSKIFCDENFKSKACEVNSNMVKARLRGLKVLVIFDDVDKLDQLHALAKEADWFGPGSRIIITTRYKSLQISSDMGLYEAKCLGEEAARKVFNHFAFGEAFSKDQVPKGFADLSSRASSLVQGHPLALKVLGSFLRGRKIEDWEAAISRLTGSPRKTVMECLRVSYHGLDEPNKGIFLTVACLVSVQLNHWRREFNGELVNRLVQLLDGEEREIRNSLNMLAEKALIDISNDGRVTTHDLILEMAKDIVYEQSPNNPGQRKFLWDSMEIYDVLEDGKGTDAIEGISLDISEMPDCPTRNGALERMRNLKFLIIHHTYFCKIDLSKIDGVFNHLPRKLKLLDWDGCPLPALPSSFKGECLVELCLPFSKLKKLSEGTLNPCNLIKMDLRSCDVLEEIPSLCGATKLDELYLPRAGVGSEEDAFWPFDSESWEYQSQNGFLPSIMGLKSLKVLSLQNWLGLSEVPESIQNFSALRELGLNGSCFLRDIPDTIGKLTSLKKLDLSMCKRLETIPDTIGRLTALEILDLRYCLSLSEIPNSIGNLTALRDLDLVNCENLEEIPYTIGELTSLKKLDLYLCVQLKTIPNTIGRLTALEILNLGLCKSVSEIPNCIGNLTALRDLNLGNCLNLKNIPNTIGELTGLKKLSLSGCEQLKTIADTIGRLTALEILNLRCCTSVSKIPNCIGNLTTLRYLDLGVCWNIKEIPDTIGNLTLLEHLSLECCHQLTTIPDTMGNLTALQSLNFSNCEMLLEIPSTIGKLTALETLNLSGCKSLYEVPSTISSLKDFYPPEDVSCILKILDGLRDGDFSFPSPMDGKKIRGYLERASGTQALEVLCIQREYSLYSTPFFQCKSLSISQHLRKLTLCNLSLWDIPNDLGDLRVLQSLDLSGNYFETLPTSIRRLSLLEQLILSFCKRIQSLPELPPSLKHLYANDCSSLRSISDVFDHPFEELMLIKCDSLGKEVVRLLIQHMIYSMPMHKGKFKTWACFSGSDEVRDCFSHQSIGQKLTIPCAGTDSGFKPVGFVAGVVVTSLVSHKLSRLNIHCHWHGEGYPSGHIHFDSENLATHVSSLSYFNFLFFVFSCNFGEDNSCDEISFHFDADWNDTDGLDHNCVIKRFGVQLCFTKELHQEQRQYIEKWEEYEESSDPGRFHQPGHYEKLNNEEEIQPPNSKRRKFFHFL